MIQYKNISFSAKTFYGTRFEPGEIKEVSGYINDLDMVRVFKAVKPVKTVEEPKKPDIVEEPLLESPRKRKKSAEPEKTSNAEIETKIVETIQEETSNGN